MRSINAAAISTGVIVALVAPNWAVCATASKFKANSVIVKYGEPGTSRLQPVYELFRTHRVLEKLSELLQPLRLPHQLLLQTRECAGVANAWSDEQSVTVCYELLDEIWKNVPERTSLAGVEPIDTLIGSSVDVFLHEAGHSVFRLLNVPIFGREEDAADQFSSYIMLRFDKDEARRLILGSAYQYKHDVSSPTITVKQRHFADEHGMPAQRLFNLLCAAYGADPKLFGQLLEQGFLPEERAVGCEGEYAQISFAFDTLIRPYIDRRLARRLYKDWLPPRSAKSQH